MTDIAEFINKDFEIVVITGNQFIQSKEFVNNYLASKLNVIHVPIFKYNKNKLFNRLIGNFIVSAQMYRFILKNIPQNAILFTVTNPIILLIFISLSIKSKNWKICLLVHDVFPDNLQVIFSKILLFRPFIYFLKKIYNQVYKKMTKLIVLGRDMQQCFILKKIELSKIKIIESWSEEKLPELTNDFNQKPCFIYSGNFGRVQGLERILGIFKNINNHILIN